MVGSNKVYAAANMQERLRCCCPPNSDAVATTVTGTTGEEAPLHHLCKAALVLGFQLLQACVFFLLLQACVWC
jgi:hypothetical protein